MWGDSQVRVHLVECAVRLCEEVKHNAPAELALALVLVHLQDLLKRRWVDLVFRTGNRHDVAVVLSQCVRIGVRVRVGWRRCAIIGR